MWKVSTGRAERKAISVAGMKLKKVPFEIASMSGDQGLVSRFVANL